MRTIGLHLHIFICSLLLLSFPSLSQQLDTPNTDKTNITLPHIPVQDSLNITEKINAAVDGLEENTFTDTLKIMEVLINKKVFDIIDSLTAFSQYRAIKSFYFHAEYESFNRPFREARTWNNQALAGIGREFAVVKSIKGNVSILYNFLHDEKSPYSRPVVFRFGFVRKKE
jgi:hypothetical protein